MSIPTQLFDNIKGRIEDTGFTSVSDYVVYVLREVLASLEEEAKEKWCPFARVFSTDSASYNRFRFLSSCMF